MNGLDDELEAAIWDAMRRHQVTVPSAVPFLDELVSLARAYAAGDSDEVTAARRAVLARETGEGQ